MTSQNRTYYEILGVSEDASFEEIRAAFRERAREYHPDRNRSPDAVERMQEVNEAYEVLRDEQQRAAYDRARRTATTSWEGLTLAQSTAITVVGELAFDLGYRMGSGINDEYSRLGIGGERTPLGIWHAAFESALEEALDSGVYSNAYSAASVSVLLAAQSSPWMTLLRTLLHARSSSVIEGDATDLVVHMLGQLASGFGYRFGKSGKSERIDQSAWKVVYDAAYSRALANLAEHWQASGYTSRGGDNGNEAIIRDVYDVAISTVTPFVAAAEAPGGMQAGSAAHSARSGPMGTQRARRGKFRWLVRLGIVSLIALAFWGISTLGGNSEPEAGDCIAINRTQPFDSQMGSYPEVSIEIVNCTHAEAALVDRVITYPQDAPYPGIARFDRDTETMCPSRAVEYTYPNEGGWQRGNRTVLCLANVPP